MRCLGKRFRKFSDPGALGRTPGSENFRNRFRHRIATDTTWDSGFENSLTRRLCREPPGQIIFETAFRKRGFEQYLILLLLVLLLLLLPPIYRNSKSHSNSSSTSKSHSKSNSNSNNIVTVLTHLASYDRHYHTFKLARWPKTGLLKHWRECVLEY